MLIPWWTKMNGITASILYLLFLLYQIFCKFNFTFTNYKSYFWKNKFCKRLTFQNWFCQYCGQICMGCINVLEYLKGVSRKFNELNVHRETFFRLLWINASWTRLLEWRKRQRFVIVSLWSTMDHPVVSVNMITGIKYPWSRHPRGLQLTAKHHGVIFQLYPTPTPDSILILRYHRSRAHRPIHITKSLFSPKPSKCKKFINLRRLFLIIK